MNQRNFKNLVDAQRFSRNLNNVGGLSIERSERIRELLTAIQADMDSEAQSLPDILREMLPACGMATNEALDDIETQLSDALTKLSLIRTMVEHCIFLTSEIERKRDIRGDFDPDHIEDVYAGIMGISLREIDYGSEADMQADIEIEEWQLSKNDGGE